MVEHWAGNPAGGNGPMLVMFLRVGAAGGWEVEVGESGGARVKQWFHHEAEARAHAGVVLGTGAWQLVGSASRGLAEAGQDRGPLQRRGGLQ